MLKVQTEKVFKYITLYIIKEEKYVIMKSSHWRLAIQSKTSYWLSLICLNELLTYSYKKCIVDCLRSQSLGSLITCAPHICMYLPSEILMSLVSKMQDLELQSGWLVTESQWTNNYYSCSRDFFFSVSHVIVSWEVRKMRHFMTMERISRFL